MNSTDSTAFVVVFIKTRQPTQVVRRQSCPASSGLDNQLGVVSFSSIWRRLASKFFVHERPCFKRFNKKNWWAFLRLSGFIKTFREGLLSGDNRRSAYWGPKGFLLLGMSSLCPCQIVPISFSQQMEATQRVRVEQVNKTVTCVKNLIMIGPAAQASQQLWSLATLISSWHWKVSQLRFLQTVSADLLLMSTFLAFEAARS